MAGRAVRARTPARMPPATSDQGFQSKLVFDQLADAFQQEGELLVSKVKASALSTYQIRQTNQTDQTKSVSNLHILTTQQICVFLYP